MTFKWEYLLFCILLCDIRGLLKVFKSKYLCLDDEHSDGLSERGRHVRVFLHGGDRCC